MSKSRHGAGTSCAPGSASGIWQNNICKWVLCTLGTKLQNLIYITKCNANSHHKGAVFTLGFGPAILKYTKYNQYQSTPPNPTQPNPPLHSWCTSTPAILEPNSDNVMRSDWSITERLHSHTVGFTYLHKNAGQKLSHYAFLHIWHYFSLQKKQKHGKWNILHWLPARVHSSRWWCKGKSLPTSPRCPVLTPGTCHCRSRWWSEA